MAGWQHHGPPRPRARLLAGALPGAYSPGNSRTSQRPCPTLSPSAATLALVSPAFQPIDACNVACARIDARLAQLPLPALARVHAAFDTAGRAADVTPAVTAAFAWWWWCVILRIAALFSIDLCA
ncbi:hypothetical protein B0H17DRAFT_1214824 [Mycena rosella]|uniref:Uncharacterized protein n=1 Tax=Mycena rosella TaxID=1033263 RepID=A0AAD7CM22_MYCRO|nr:hypothetical protein B0H17DRAFT_1214824 [Mycena rosella]